MSEDPRRARCNKCSKFFKENVNTILKNHGNLYCKMMKFGMDRSRATTTNHGTNWTYDQSLVWEWWKFMIQESLSFDYFDSPQLTKLIHETLQPCYWIAVQPLDKIQLILGISLTWNYSKFRKNVTFEAWSTPHSSPILYICVTVLRLNSQNCMKCRIVFELFGYLHWRKFIYNFELHNKHL